MKKSQKLPRYTRMTEAEFDLLRSRLDRRGGSIERVVATSGRSLTTIRRISDCRTYADYVRIAKADAARTKVAKEQPRLIEEPKKKTVSEDGLMTNYFNALLELNKNIKELTGALWASYRQAANSGIKNPIQSAANHPAGAENVQSPAADN